MSLSRKALTLKGALMVYLRPLLAQDAKVDLDLVLDGIDNENYPDEKRALLERIRNALRGKLAAGASIGDLHQLLAALEQVPEPEGRASDEPDAVEGRPGRVMERLTAEDQARVERVTRFSGAQDAFLDRFPEMRRVKVLG